MYLLGALYADIAERHQQQQDQGSMDLKGLFNDLKIRLEGQFELTKDQMVRVITSALITDTELKKLEQYSQSHQRHDLRAHPHQFRYDEC